MAGITDTPDRHPARRDRDDAADPPGAQQPVHPAAHPELGPRRGITGWTAGAAAAARTATSWRPTTSRASSPTDGGAGRPPKESGRWSPPARTIRRRQHGVARRLGQVHQGDHQPRHLGGPGHQGRRRDHLARLTVIDDQPSHPGGWRESPLTSGFRAAAGGTVSSPRPVRPVSARGRGRGPRRPARPGAAARPRSLLDDRPARFDFGPGSRCAGLHRRFAESVLTPMPPVSASSRVRRSWALTGAATTHSATTTALRGRPFSFSVAVPEGNYRVTRDPRRPRRRIIHDGQGRVAPADAGVGARPRPGEFATRTFTVNVRTPLIAGGGRGEAQGPREGRTCTGTTSSRWNSTATAPASAPSRSSRPTTP